MATSRQYLDIIHRKELTHEQAVELIDLTVRNFSHPNPAVRITETIYFPQAGDPRVVQELLDKALGHVAGIMADPKPYALFRGAKDGVSEYSMRYYIDDYKDKDTATENVWKSVLDHIAKSDLKIAFPRRYLEIHNDPLPGLAKP
jgi:small-conductance mechanosensitive channel